jgi:hypothetical protein
MNEVGKFKRIFFYTGLEQNEFTKLLQRELELLEKNKMRFIIFKNRNLFVPEMSFDGKITSGLNNIKYELDSMISH